MKRALVCCLVWVACTSERSDSKPGARSPAWAPSCEFSHAPLGDGVSYARFDCAWLGESALTEEEANAIDAYLGCTECWDGELDQVVALGERAEPALCPRLMVGLTDEERSAYEASLRDSYAQLRDYLADHGEEPSMSEEAYVATYLGNMVAVNQARSAYAIELIDSPHTLPMLEGALAAGDMRPDTRDSIALMVQERRSPDAPACTSYEAMTPYDLGYTPTRMMSVGAELFLAHEHGFEILDVSDPAAPSSLGIHATEQAVQSFTIFGSSVFLLTGAWDSDLGDYAMTFEIVDVSAPEAPHRMSATPVGAATNLAVVGDHAYVVGTQGLRTFDVTDPTAPRALDHYDTPYARAVSAACGYVFVTSHASEGFIVLTEDSQGDLELLASTPGGGNEVVVRDGFAYTLDYGVRVMDLADPSLVSEVGRRIVSGWDLALDVHDGIAAIAAGDDVHLVDLTNPRAPVSLGTIDESVWAMAWMGSYLFSASSSQLNVWDIASCL
jgi:hypothetical protein